jgi:outer membrane immunogenic protein
MKSFLMSAVAVAGLCVAASGPTQAQSQDDALRRLEAKLDALAKENAALRNRVNQIEATRPAPRQATTPTNRQASTASAPTETRSAAPALPQAAGNAYAANMPVNATAGLSGSTCPAARFGGFHAGIHGGGVNHTANRTDRDAYLTAPIGVGVGTFVTKEWGGVIGGQAGYTFALCNAIWGVEVDGSWASVDSRMRIANFPDVLAELTTVLKTLATARTRTGIVVDNLLLYVTGGVAAVRTQTNWATNFFGFGDTEILSLNQWRTGWVAGFGSEWALTERISVRSEALYIDLMDKDYALASPFLSSVLGPTSVNFKNSDSMWVARFGANVKLTN